MSAPDEITGPINLGNPVEMKISHLAEQIISMIGSKSKIKFEPLPNDDPTQRCPDITLAETLLNWKPKIDLQTGLEKTINYFDQLLTQKG